MDELQIGLMARSATSWPLFVAESQGYFASAQLDVRIMASNQAEAHFRRLLDGAYSVGHQNADHVLRAAATGAELTIFLRLTRVPYYLVTVPEITNYADLVGRTVASEPLGRGHGPELQRMFSANDIDEQACQVLAMGGGAERLRALREGRASAGLFDPGTAARLAHQGFRVLDNSGPYLDERVGPVAAARSEWLRTNRALARSYVLSYLLAEQWLKEPRNRSTAAAILAGAIDLPLDAAETAWDLLMGFPQTFTASQEVRPEELVRLAGLAANSELPPKDPARLQSLVDGTIVSEAKAAAGERLLL